MIIFFWIDIQFQCHKSCYKQCPHLQCLQSPWQTGTLPGSCLLLFQAWLQIFCSCLQTTPTVACSRSAHVPAPSRNTIRVRNAWQWGQWYWMWDMLFLIIPTSLSVKWDLSFSCSGVKYRVFSSENERRNMKSLGSQNQMDYPVKVWSTYHKTSYHSLLRCSLPHAHVERNAWCPSSHRLWGSPLLPFPGLWVCPPLQNSISLYPDWSHQNISLWRDTTIRKVSTSTNDFLS